MKSMWENIIECIMSQWRIHNGAKRDACPSILGSTLQNYFVCMQVLSTPPLALFFRLQMQAPRQVNFLRAPVFVCFWIAWTASTGQLISQTAQIFNMFIKYIHVPSNTCTRILKMWLLWASLSMLTAKVFSRPKPCTIPILTHT